MSVEQIKTAIEQLSFEERAELAASFQEMSLVGIVRNGVVVLQPEMNLPEGTKVSIRLVGPLSESLLKSASDDPDFERAIAAFAEAEAKEQDPLEGEAVDLATNPAAREELRRILRGD